MIGIVPYAGVDLSVFFTLKEAWKARHPGQEPTVLTHLTCGAISSFCGQVVAYVASLSLSLSLWHLSTQERLLGGRPLPLADTRSNSCELDCKHKAFPAVRSSTRE